MSSGNCVIFVGLGTYCNFSKILF